MEHTVSEVAKNWAALAAAAAGVHRQRHGRRLHEKHGGAAHGPQPTPLILAPLIRSSPRAREGRLWWPRDSRANSSARPPHGRTGAACKGNLSDYWDALAITDAPLEQL